MNTRLITALALIGCVGTAVGMLPLWLTTPKSGEVDRSLRVAAAKTSISDGALAAVSAPTSDTTVTGTTPSGASAADAKPTSSIAGSPPTAPVPAQLAGLQGLTAKRQVEFLSGLQERADLSQDIIDWLLAELSNRSWSELARNAMANALVVHVAAAPTLHHRLLAAIDDPSETPKWREYSVQHLARCAAGCPEPELVFARLKDLAARGDGGIAGTAMMHLDLLDREGVLTLDQTFVATVAKQVGDPAAGVLTRMSGLSLLGRRRERDQLPLIRSCAVAAEPGLRRTAIAALGLIGDPADLELITAALHDPDSLVAAAARAAHRRLTETN